MRLVHMTTTGKLEVNYLWLPTWLGINQGALRRLEKVLAGTIVGMEVTEENLDQISDLVLEAIVKEHPIEGLRDYLEGIKFVQTGL